MKKNKMTFASITALTQLEFNDKNMSKIEFMRTGKWKHPVYGEVLIDQDRLNRFKENFDNGVRSALHIDIEHKRDNGAVGWVGNIEVEGPFFNEKGKEYYRLMGEVEWTDEGRTLIKSKKYRFFSPTIADTYVTKTDGKQIKDVIVGGALTNTPFFEELEEVTVMSEPQVINNERKENQMTLEQMKAKLREDRKFSLAENASDEEKSTFQQAQAEMFSEVAETLETTKTEFSELNTAHEELKSDREKTFAEQETEATKIFTELGVTNVAEAKALKEKMQKAEFAEVEAQVKEFTLPKNVEAVTKFAMTLDAEARKTYFETLKGQGDLKKFTEEQGGEGDDAEDAGKAPEGVSEESYALDQKAKKYREAHAEEFKGMSEEDAYRKSVYAVSKE